MLENRADTIALSKPSLRGSDSDRSNLKNGIASLPSVARNDNHCTHINVFPFVISALGLFCLCHSTFAQEEYKYEDKGKRNPFIPLVTSDGRLLKLDKEEVKGDLSVEGIIFDKSGRSFAIVNGSVVGIGDTIAGYSILKIEDNKVTFIKDGEAKVIEIKKEGE